MNPYSGDEGVPCPDCVKRQGLCGRHKKGILPQLAQPWWYKLVGVSQSKTAGQLSLEDMSPEARRVYNRKRTKAARQAARQANMDRARLASLESLSAA